MDGHHTYYVIPTSRLFGNVSLSHCYARHGCCNFLGRCCTAKQPCNVVNSSLSPL